MHANTLHNKRGAIRVLIYAKHRNAMLHVIRMRPIRWNNIYNRCRKCFRPNHQGNCEKCFIPSKIYHLTEEAWRKKRCMICHAEKKYVIALLCGGVFCMMKFVSITKPKEFPILGTTNSTTHYIAGYTRLIWS